MAVVRIGPEARNSISKQLKKFREDKKMSKAELGRITNMTVQTIINIEDNQTNYGIDRVLLILDALDESLTIPVQ
jgi:transcriptional regulator with XRE-family HTH domain